MTISDLLQMNLRGFLLIQVLKSVRQFVRMDRVAGVIVFLNRRFV